MSFYPLREVFGVAPREFDDPRGPWKAHEDLISKLKYRASEFDKPYRLIAEEGFLELWYGGEWTTRFEVLGVTRDNPTEAVVRVTLCDDQYNPIIYHDYYLRPSQDLAFKPPETPFLVVRGE